MSIEPYTTTVVESLLDITIISGDGFGAITYVNTTAVAAVWRVDATIARFLSNEFLPTSDYNPASTELVLPTGEQTPTAQSPSPPPSETGQTPGSPSSIRTTTSPTTATARPAAPTLTTPPAPASSSGLSRGATAGAALGAVLGLSILAALLAWLLVLPHYRRRRAAAQPDYRMGGLLRSDIVPAERRRGPDAAAQTRILTLTAYEKQPQELGTGAEVAEVERERPRPAVELEADVPVPGTERAEEQEGTQVPGSGAESARLGQSA